jgi:hypothetical protein
MPLFFRSSRNGLSAAELSATFQLLLVKSMSPKVSSSSSNPNIVYVARTASSVLGIDIQEAHHLCVEMDKQGAAVVGTFTRRQCMDMERDLRSFGIACRSIPAPTEDGGIVKGDDFSVVSAANTTSTSNDTLDEFTCVSAGTGSAGGMPSTVSDIYDAYAYRMEPSVWESPDELKANAHFLHDVCMIEFCMMFGISKKTSKIKTLGAPRTTNPKFSPVYCSDKGSDDYGKYCRFSLVKYRPWVGKPFGGAEPSEVESMELWEEYFTSASFRERQRRFPDIIIPDEWKIAREEQQKEQNEALLDDLRVHGGSSYGDEVKIDSDGRMLIEI